MIRLLTPLLLALAALALPAPADADPADIDAAARGVVRVVVIGRDGEEIFPVSHGTGFAVTAETIVTNAHVVADAIEDPRLSLGIVPSDGGEAVFGRLVAVSSRNDLALVQTTAPMGLPPLSIAGNPPAGAGTVTSVGFPQNVDRAQGLAMEDLFRAQPPVKSPGFLSGRRPSREFDTLLHTAPIARGSSGGPLLDECGRVIGVNSFGTDSDAADAEFFFAVSTRELLPFLRANRVSPRVNAMPCRSLADLDAAERAREAEGRAAAAAETAQAERALARRREDVRRATEFEVIEQRDNLMALAFLLLLAAMAAGGFAWRAHQRREEEGEEGDLDDGAGDPEAPSARRAPAFPVAGGIALAALAGAAGVWYARPGFDTIDARVEESLRAEMAEAKRGPIAPERAGGRFACALDEERSRITGEAASTLALDWSEDGCINRRTQYGREGGAWIRVFLPASEAAVSVNRFDPAAGEFVIERFLLDSAAMSEARAARAGYQAPACPASPEAASAFGERQAGVMALLPARPNERLVYACTLRGAGG